MNKGVKAITFLLSPLAGLAFIIGLILHLKGDSTKLDAYEKHRLKSKFK